MAQHIQQEFGNIDIYLFDQLLKGTYADCTAILDAGCGAGRNIEFFLKNGYEVYGVDSKPESIEAVKQLASSLSLKSVADNFFVGDVENLPFEDEYFDLVISSAVLHFANDLAHFEAMLNSMWRVLKPGGYLFARLASDIGIESAVKFIGNGRYILPDKSERFLINEQMLLDFTQRLGGLLHEPIKTTNVQGLRCMTTWCVRK
ncbi:class I SAM-dependent methyltransferase [Pedobacter aquatilis]|uniref:class I SAM-dependent methyltransferase n=1 Tax=Pedobacter aquatilis TaxID=351343 RepID=UPI0029308F58|nr:class I SAM-dependent methyltransferase [Pedobacter aquatilis]